MAKLRIFKQIDCQEVIIFIQIYTMDFEAIFENTKIAFLLKATPDLTRLFLFKMIPYLSQVKQEGTYFDGYRKKHRKLNVD